MRIETHSAICGVGGDCAATQKKPAGGWPAGLFGWWVEAARIILLTCLARRRF
jgi:hypothetical protein